MASNERHYRFGPRDRQGLFLGIKTSQVFVIAGVLVLVVLELRSLRSPLRLPLGFVELIGGALFAFYPVRGRTIDEWAPVAVRYVSTVLAGSQRAIHVAPGARQAPPAVFSRLEIIEVTSSEGQQIGVCHDRGAGTITGVLVAGGESFALLDDDERERRVAGWASVLAALGNGSEPPHRLQWIERTVPDRRDAIRRRALGEFIGDASHAQRAAREAYRAFVEREAVAALRHETLLAVTVQVPSGITKRHARSVRVDDLAAAQLVRSLTSLQQRCRDAGLVVDGTLTADGLRAVMRRGFEHAEAEPARRPWPLACAERWSDFRTDGTLHATFWIAEWPRSDVGSDFLLPLLVAAGDRRVVSVVMAPVETRKAVRAAEHARTTARADSELRRRHGFAQSARTNREQDSVERREDELAAGHAGYRFSGYLVVTGESSESLEQACGRVQQAASVSRLELYRLYGAQAEGFLFGLPLGRGCA